MKKLENKEGINRIIMKPIAFVKCAIGQDWYKCAFEIEFFPGEYYPDYMEVNSFIMQEIDGKELNIEEATKIIREYMLQYEPKAVIVTNHIEGCKTHFDVDVMIG